jgi:hypothetical protein
MSNAVMDRPKILKNKDALEISLFGKIDITIKPKPKRTADGHYMHKAQIEAMKKHVYELSKLLPEINKIVHNPADEDMHEYVASMVKKFKASVANYDSDMEAADDKIMNGNHNIPLEDDHDYVLVDELGWLKSSAKVLLKKYDSNLQTFWESLYKYEVKNDKGEREFPRKLEELIKPRETFLMKSVKHVREFSDYIQHLI